MDAKGVLIAASFSVNSWMPKQKLWVIFAGPQQFNGPNRYIDSEAKTTDMGARAVKFSSREDAKSFFDKHKIRPTCQIGEASFEDHEV
jgi:hypothetical protein